MYDPRTWPTLYARDKKGNALAWMVHVENQFVVVQHGRQHGKLTTKITESKPKNVGRANETSGHEQALKEAQSKWTKQIQREDYAENIEESGAQQRPMLALDYRKVPHRLDWNGGVYAQAKLDGLRLLYGKRWANEPNAWNEMLTRKGEVYKLPHLEEDAATLLSIARDMAGSLWEVEALDGEVYNPGWDLGDILSAARKVSGATLSLKYYVFDLKIPGMAYQERRGVLQEALFRYWTNTNKDLMRGVPALTLREGELQARHDEYVNEGYEGIILRRADSTYEQGRSTGLFKYKHFYDEEFRIVNTWPDKNGNAMLTVETQDGVRVDVTPKRSHKQRKAMLDQFLTGKWITVQFQAWTPDGSLQFPVGLEIREVNIDGEPIV